jgi:hypothetical protein
MTKKMSDYKPKNWTGTCEDQLELFIEILAYLIEREVLDRNNKCMSVESFCHYVPLLIQNEGHYEVAIQRFEEMLADWNVEYLPETGIKDQLIVNGHLSKKLFCTRMLAKIPNGKHKKYADVYEELE